MTSGSTRIWFISTRAIFARSKSLGTLGVKSTLISMLLTTGGRSIPYLASIAAMASRTVAISGSWNLTSKLSEESFGLPSRFLTNGVRPRIPAISDWSHWNCVFLFNDIPTASQSMTARVLNLPRSTSGRRA
ncbi:hypothetical protein D3C80_1754780 [compost metagenome]